MRAMREVNRAAAESSISGNRERTTISGQWMAWISALAEGLLPTRAAPPARHALLLIGEAGAQAFLVKGEHSKLLGELPASCSEEAAADFKAKLSRNGALRIPARLRLTRDQVLLRPLTFPAGVRDVLGPVIANQMLRHVPWSEEDLRFGYVVEDVGNQLSVKVVATSRQRLNTALELSERLGLRTDAIDFRDDQAKGANILIADLRQQQRSRLTQRLASGLGLFLGAALLLGALGGWLAYERRNRLDALASEARGLRDSLRNLQSANGRGVPSRTGAAALAERKHSLAPAVLVLGELTRALPDEAWLSGLTIAGDSLTIAGRAHDAATLIAALEASRRFSDVRFVAPTVQEGNHNRQVFSISARITPRGPAGD